VSKCFANFKIDPQSPTLNSRLEYRYAIPHLKADKWYMHARHQDFS
jgi:hypothetical protein